MNIYSTTITLDVGAQTYFPVVRVKQYDSARTIRIKLKAHGETYDLSGVAKVQFRCEKPDKHAVKFNAEIIGNDIVVDLSKEDNQCTVVPGKAKCDVVCVGEDGGVLSSAIFYLEIVAAPEVENTIASSDAYADLENAIAEAYRITEDLTASDVNYIDKEGVGATNVQEAIDYVLWHGSGGSLPTYILRWSENPSDVAEYNTSEINKIRNKDVGTYSLFLSVSGKLISAYEIHKSSTIDIWFRGAWNGESDAVFKISSGMTVSEYAQRKYIVPESEFDPLSLATPSMLATAEYIDERIGTTDNLDPDSYLKDLPIVTLEWLNKNQSGDYPAQKIQDNIRKLSELSAMEPDAYILYLSYKNVLYNASFVSNSLYCTTYDDTSEQVVRFKISYSDQAGYIQSEDYTVNPINIFDDTDPVLPASQYAVASYVDTRIGTTGNLDPDSYASASDVSAIEDLIPSQASDQNQLADKDFVNSTVSTNTAYFVGTFDSIQTLTLYVGIVTNNDYAFVVIYNSANPTQIDAYDRFKYNDQEYGYIALGTVTAPTWESDTYYDYNRTTNEYVLTESEPEDWSTNWNNYFVEKLTPGCWLFEYELNNSSFTAEQWAAINSGMTASLVTRMNNHMADTTIHVTAEDKIAWNAKYDKPSGGIPSSDLSSGVQTSLGKADTALQSIPPASASTLGGIKVGDNLSIDQNGVLSAEPGVGIAVIGHSLVISTEQDTLEVIANARY